MEQSTIINTEMARIVEIREKLGPLSKDHIALLMAHKITADQLLQALAEVSKARP